MCRISTKHSVSASASRRRSIVDGNGQTTAAAAEQAAIERRSIGLLKRWGTSHDHGIDADLGPRTSSFYTNGYLGGPPPGRYGSDTMAAEHVPIVDDDEAVRGSVDGLLRSVGLETTAFDSAEEFLGSPHRVTTRCLILDLWMPRMSGRELQQRMVADGHRVPIVILTASTEEDARTRALEAGAVAFLSKPVDGDTLIAAVQLALTSQ
jgi:CheY-like chemotaxis protein